MSLISLFPLCSDRYVFETAASTAAIEDIGRVGQICLDFLADILDRNTDCILASITSGQKLAANPFKAHFYTG